MRLAYQTVRRRIYHSLTTIPSLANWRHAMAIFAGYGLFAFWLGTSTGFLHWQPLQSTQQWLVIALKTFLMPALGEELLFRVVLLPSPSKQISLRHRLMSIGISLFLFVIYHPLNALTFYPAGNPTFLSSTFLTLVVGLAIATTHLYYRTKSIWPAVILHWLTVVVWIGGLGGFERLH